MKIKLLVGFIFISCVIVLIVFGYQSYMVASPEPVGRYTGNPLGQEIREVVSGITKPVLTVIFLLSFFGVCEIAYVMRTRLTAKPAVCPIGNHASCSVVLESNYNTFLGIHNDLLGFAYYATVALLSLLLNLGIGPAGWIKVVLVALVSGGTAMTMYLTYIQAYVLRAWCFWCLTSAGTTWLLAAFIIQHALFT